MHERRSRNHCGTRGAEIRSLTLPRAPAGQRQVIRALLSSTILGSALLAGSPGAALAACAPPAGAGTPSSGTVVTCSGTTTDQNAPNGYGDASLTGVTVNVGTGATLTGTGTGIVAGAGGNTVFNRGTVTGNGGTAIDFLAGNNNFLTLAPSSIINGIVTGTGAGNRLQLGGTSSADAGSFDSSLIGPAAQYRGFSTFNKVGSSPWTLTGVGTQTWNVSGGTLQVDGAIGGANVTGNGRLRLNGGTVGGPVAVTNSGVLLGNGTVGTTTLAAISVLEPGASNAIGTIAVNGNLTFGNFTTYLVDLTPATADLVNVSLNANLAGTLMAVAAEGSYTPGQYLLLSTTGIVNGTFGAFHPIGNFNGLNVALAYDLNNVRLVLSTQPTGQDSQWLANPATNNWNTAANWNPAAVANGTATFGASTQTSLDFSPGTTSIQSMVFQPGAPAYTFGVDAVGGGTDILDITGGGIVNNSPNRPTFFVGGVGGATVNFRNGSSAGDAIFNTFLNAAIYSVNFYDSSTAANATISGFGTFVAGFHNSSTAGNATLINDNVGGDFAFFDNSSAGNATINILTDIGGVVFSDSATAANAQILNRSAASRVLEFNGAFNATNLSGGVVFRNTSSAGNATITNDGGSTVFQDSASAGTATFVNSGSPSFGSSLSFLNNSTAASATITNNADGTTFFAQSSTAGTAAITNNDGGLTQFFGANNGGTATVTNNSGGQTHLRLMAQADTLTIINNAGGIVDISEDPMQNPAFVAPSVAIGSLSGAGNVFLGNRNLTLGNLNGNDTISGVIADGGQFATTGGSLTKTGAGTLILAGDNTFTGATTINAGVLQLGDGGASGAVAGDIANNAAVVINRSGNLALNGAFSGAGSLTQTGTVVTTLGGNSPGFTGASTIDGGAMLVNGFFGNSPFTVNDGATLGGTGTVGNTTVNAGGTLSPGNSIGVLNIDGNLVLGAGAIYRVEVSPTAADRTNVSGTAALDGTVHAVFGPGSYMSSSYTILSASGGRSGTFNALTTEGLPATLSASLSYTSTDVLLVTLTSQIAPTLPTVPQPGSLAGATPNQIAVATAQDTAFNSGLPNISALYGLSRGQLPAALDQLSGEVHASTAGVLVDESLYPRSAVLGRLRQASYGGNTSMASLAVGGPQAAFAGGEELSALAYAKSPLPTKAPMRAPAATSDIVFWAQGFGAWGRFDGDGNATSVRRDLAGFITGLDTRVGEAGRAGIAAGFTGSRNALDGRGSANVETAHVLGYGGWSFGALNLRAGGGYALHSIDTDRTIAFPGFFDRATARLDGGTGQVFGELGYGFAFGHVAIEPFAGGAWVRIDTDAAAERGGAAALNIAANSFEAGYSTLGIRAASMIPVGDGMVLVPRASAAWQHAFDAVTPAARLAFQNAGVPFVVAGVPIARDSLLAEAGLDLAISRNATLGVSYTGQIARNVNDHAAKGKFSWKF